MTKYTQAITSKPPEIIKTLLRKKLRKKKQQQKTHRYTLRNDSGENKHKCNCDITIATTTDDNINNTKNRTKSKTWLYFPLANKKMAERELSMKERGFANIIRHYPNERQLPHVKKQLFITAFSPRGRD